MLKAKPTRWVLISFGILVVIGGLVLLMEPKGHREPKGQHEVSTNEAEQGGKPPAPTEIPAAITSTQAYAMVSPRKQQLIGVTTAVVEKRSLETTVRAVGRIEYDEQRITHVNLRISGWVEDLFVDYTGQVVRKGEPLFTLYSPDLVASQDELLLALRAREKVKNSPLSEVHQQADQLVDAARDRLRLWTLTNQQIDEIVRRGKANTYLTIYAPVTGYVIEKPVFKGMFVQPETRVYSIADLSQVWMNAEIYEFEVPFVTVGQLGTATFTAYPGEQFHGRVSYIYPYLNQEARTVKVRLEMPNPTLLLKPEMYGTVQIAVHRGVQLALPEGALLDSGTRKLVFVTRGEGLFEPREVTVGPKIGAYYEVQKGVQAGERVVTSGNFLIDSESKLMAATNMMGSLGMGGVKMEQAQMGKMDMGEMNMEGSQKTTSKRSEFEQHKQADGLSISLSTQPASPRIGQNVIRVTVINKDGKPVSNANVQLTYTMPMPGMMPATVPMKRGKDGTYEATVNLGMAGQWDLTITVERPGQTNLKETFSVTAGGGMSGMQGM
ncbi:Efflux transporter, RND family, MFP subunit (modular protein) [Nitrospira moscoviensis]|jgi:Cu(I)/Ag(I) efflux system membrane fusion protein|uniref:Efflux transporter, RND family, MFP subunit (Modular protein) n=2 Tax=Nitrospira moscoviensis TaxID=42253 RepID=A0A0K2GEM5_NITMO|nr:Efflux transporter, RND family, MFP subunit (modular protein) [Nitrospira moscoviensis]